MKSALKILCRQCSLLACANIISSTSVGLRAELAERASTQVVDLVVGERQAELAVGARQRGAACAEHVDRARIGSRRLLVEQVRAHPSRSASTLSVMRSCSSAATALRSAVASGFAAAEQAALQRRAGTR